ncbi:MAG: TIGR03435 family protein [Acidobacteria bacterium]|nr:TIGR03435 family protein [Acidobacteriota bacterium]
MASRPFALIFLTAAAAFSQKSFDVATIKPNAGNDQRAMVRVQPGGLSATGINVRFLMMQAFDIRDFQIIGGPGWITTDRYDINAKAEGLPDRVPPEILRPMMEALLVERFGLKYHRESKELPVYALVAGKGPHKMKAAASAGGEPRQMFRMGRGQATLQGATMAAVAQTLSQQLGRKVIDKTGIDGRFDIELHWTPEPGQGGGPFGPPPPGTPDAITSSDSGPSIFSAVQEQLGLKLESQKGPVDVIVVDSVSKPTEN